VSSDKIADLALFGGRPALSPASDQPRALSAAAVRAAIALVRSSRRDSDLLCAHDGQGVVCEFEAAFAEVTGARYAVAVSSGTAALLGLLMAHNVGPGAEVLVNAYGWGSGAGAVRALGATPVFVDIDDSLGLSATDAARQITSRTRAILATHVFGTLADVNGLQALATHARIPLLFDGAQALGAHFEGAAIGSLGAATAFSLGRRKLVYAGEGGIIVTSDRAVYERLVIATQHPLRARVEASSTALRRLVDEGSLSARIHPVAAAIALAQVSDIAVRAGRQRATGQRITAGLANGGAFSLPRRGDGDVPQSLVLRYRRPTAGPGRAAVVDALQAEGVPAVIGPVRVPLHLRAGFRALREHDSERPRPASLPQVERFCRAEEVMIEDANCWLSTSRRRADALSRGIRKVDAALRRVRAWEVNDASL
jgi:dTDP-4-amino-4,6-dideoxygalactose transaminase